jgi:transposase
VKLYQSPPTQTHVICIDEMGPVSAKTYPTARWSSRRPPLTPDYGRRAKVWVFGAFEPQTGLALTCPAAGRGASHFLALLDQIVAGWPQGELIFIMDNLASHKTLDVRLWALAHPRVRFLFQPTYAPWLNLIEPWWKTLRSLALKGRRFEDADELTHAIAVATQYWNQHRKPYVWRKTIS